MPVTKEKKPIVFIAIAAAVIACIGSVVLLSNKAQQSDPTFTAAPPAGPNAIALHPSEAKAKNWKNGWKTAVPGMVARPKEN